MDKYNNKKYNFYVTFTNYTCKELITDIYLNMTYTQAFNKAYEYSKKHTCTAPGDFELIIF